MPSEQITIENLEKFLNAIDKPPFPTIADEIGSMTLFEVVTMCTQKLSNYPLSSKSNPEIHSKLQALRKIIDNVLKINEPQKTEVRSSIQDNNQLKKNIKFMNGRVNCPFCFSPEQNIYKLSYHLEKCTMLAEKCFFVPKELSCFQIVASGFKCNVCSEFLSDYFKKESHLKSEGHILKFNEGTKDRAIATNVCFCSFCHETIPDSEQQLNAHTQLDTHVKLQAPGLRRDLLNSKVGYVLLRKHLRCLSCNKNVPLSAVKGHMSDTQHVNKTRNHGYVLAWCCLCDTNLYLNGLDNHISDVCHQNQMKVLHTCLFCGFTCPSDNEMIDHTTDGCKELNRMRSTAKGASAKPNEANSNTTTDTNEKSRNPFKFKTKADHVKENTAERLSPSNELVNFVQFLTVQFDEFQTKLVDFSDSVGLLDVLHVLKNTVNDMDWKVIGSRFYKLQYEDSSIDLSCRLQNMPNTISNLYESVMKYQGLTEVIVNQSTCAPHISCRYLDDLTIRFFIETESCSQQNAFLSELMESCSATRAFILIVKFWNKTILSHDILPPFIVTILAACYPTFHDEESNDSAKNLLRGFFLFYSKFDFEKNAIYLSEESAGVQPRPAALVHLPAVISSFDAPVAVDMKPASLENFKKMCGLTLNLWSLD